MSSTNLPAPSAGGSKNAKKTRNLSFPLDVWEMVVTQYLLPGCTWDSVEECAGWCREVVVDPTPLRRMGWDWEDRATGMRALLEALYVRMNPREFCRGAMGTPHPIAILLREVIGRSPVWQAEMRSQSLWAVHKDSLDFPIYITWARRDHEEGMVQRIIEDELPAWCTTMNPGVQNEYFYLWQDLNMLYERLSLPWKRIPRPTPSRLGFQLQEPIRMAIDALYFDIENLWNIRKGNVQNHDALPLEEQVRAYEGGELHPYLGRRTPWMKLDYDRWDTRVEQEDNEFLPQPREKHPRKLYRQHCTWRELAILNRECSVDGIPWVKDGTVAHDLMSDNGDSDGVSTDDE